MQFDDDDFDFEEQEYQLEKDLLELANEQTKIIQERNQKKKKKGGK